MGLLSFVQETQEILFLPAPSSPRCKGRWERYLVAPGHKYHSTGLSRNSEIPTWKISVLEKCYPRRSRGFKLTYPLVKFCPSIIPVSKQETFPFCLHCVQMLSPPTSPHRPRVLPLPANNCSWLITAPISEGSEGLCFLPGTARNIWDPQVFPLLAAVPADLGCHSGESSLAVDSI